MGEPESVWVFNGTRSTFPSGVFKSKRLAEDWIRKHSLTGTLTQYPLDVGMYEFANASRFSPKKPRHTTSEFIGQFSGGGLDHFHFEGGK
jgi:hypothetical protein